MTRQHHDIEWMKCRDMNETVAKSEVSGRIRRTGELLRLDTNPTVPKAVGIIQVKETSGELTGQDRKALNWLLHNAFDRISEPVVHEANESDLRQYLSSHESNDRIKDITKRLASTLLSYDYLDEDGLPEWGAGSLIIISGSSKKDKIYYEFPHWLRPLLAEPAKWARLSLCIMQKFSSKYALALYENLEANANKSRSIWEVEVESFRAILGVKEGKLKTFNDLHRRVLEPSLKEINEHADFTAKYSIIGRDGRKITRLRFDITKREERKEEEKLAKYRKNRPSVGSNTRVPLRAETFDRVRKLASGADVYAIENDWRAWISDKEPPKNPDGAFIQFAKKWYEKRQGKFLY